MDGRNIGPYERGARLENQVAATCLDSVPQRSAQGSPSPRYSGGLRTTQRVLACADAWETSWGRASLTQTVICGIDSGKLQAGLQEERQCCQRSKQSSVQSQLCQGCLRRRCSESTYG
eukprot:2012762-Amphidinium_carterae.3